MTCSEEWLNLCVVSLKDFSFKCSSRIGRECEREQRGEDTVYGVRCIR
jgi:hypothetical protein